MIEKIVCPLLNLLDKGNVALIDFEGISPFRIMCLEYDKKTKKCMKRNAEYKSQGDNSCIYSKWESL